MVLLLLRGSQTSSTPPWAIHYNSPRADHPFVVLDSAALAETLLESELFVPMRVAFTGAIANKKGVFEGGDGGMQIACSRLADNQRGFREVGSKGLDSGVGDAREGQPCLCRQ